MDTKHIALHVFKAPKYMDFDKAQEEAHNYIDKKKKYHKELKNYYVFRNLPKSNFKPNTFKTIKVNNNAITSLNNNAITSLLVYGELKDTHTHLHGSGLGSFFKKVIQAPKKIINYVIKAFSPAKEYNNVSTNTLNQYNTGIITKISVYRTPIHSMIEKFLNFVSNDKFKQEKQKLDYDKLFHLALIVQVSLNGVNKNIIIEKNEVINISTTYKSNSDTEVIDVPYTPSSLNLGEFMTKAENSVPNETYFRYNAFSNNCQNYLKIVLEANHLYSPTLDKFIFQDLTNFNVGNTTKRIANVVTDLGGITNRIVGGKNKSKQTK